MPVDEFAQYSECDLPAELPAHFRVVKAAHVVFSAFCHKF